MYYQHAKSIAWRRYDDKIAVVNYRKDRFNLLAEPAASLWELLANPLSLGDATHFFAGKLSRPISERAMQKTLDRLVDQDLLIADDAAAGLAAKYHAIDTSRGFYVEDVCAGFINAMKPYTHAHQLLKADLEINSACNLRCVHCYISDYRDRNLMTLDEINRLFDELAEIGVVFLNLTGGEMTLRKDFIDIIQATRDHNFVTSILTNATRLSDDQLERLKIATPANAYVSLYGVDRETHEFITDKEGTFATTMDNVRRLREVGVPVVLRYLIMRHNVHQVEALPEFADKHDCLYSTSHNLFVTDGPKEFLAEHRVTDAQMAELWTKNLIKPLGKGACTAGTQRVRIDAQGNLYPCELLRVKYGNVRESTVVDIMSEPQTLQHLKQTHAIPQGCSTCSKNSFCPRCPGLAHHEDGNMLGNSSLACRTTDAYQNLVNIRLQ